MNHNLYNFYVFVNNENKLILDKIQKLPENWRNIAGLPGLSDEELRDLTWAGWTNHGWINIRSEEIKNYSHSPENLELNKNTFKHLISEIRKEQQLNIVDYDGARIQPNKKTLYSLFLLQSKEKVNFKCMNGYYTFTSEQIKELYGILELHIQKWFDWEMNVYSQIDSCQNVSDFLNVNYDF
jgi:hypothetical protein